MHYFSPVCLVRKVLTGIFGVGAKTADRWIREGILGLQQLQDSGQTLNRAQQAGLCLCSSLHSDSVSARFCLSERFVVSQASSIMMTSTSRSPRQTLMSSARSWSELLSPCYQAHR